MLPLRPGRIIIANIEDKNGNLKRRPAVIASPVPDDEDGPLVVFAITSKFENPTPPNEIPLSADPDGKQGTFLMKDSVVACHWPNRIKKSDIVRVGGELPVPELRIMAHFYRSLLAKMRTTD